MGFVLELLPFAALLLVGFACGMAFAIGWRGADVLLRVKNSIKKNPEWRQLRGL